MSNQAATFGPIAKSITNKLQSTLDPVELVVTDQSHLHVGHVGERPQGQSHFDVLIVTVLFKGKSRIKRQRMIHDILSKELESDIHALSVVALTPEEFSNRA